MTVYRRPDPIPLRHSAVASPGGLNTVKHEPDDLNRLVAREIFQAIASGHFPVGSILPNEHQLSADLGVSRTALREAIKGLASKGLVETRRKRGTLVLDRSRWDMLNPEVIAWSRKFPRALIALALMPELPSFSLSSRTGMVDRCARSPSTSMAAPFRSSSGLEAQ